MDEFLRLGLLNWFPIKLGAKVLVTGDNIFVKDLHRRGCNVSYVEKIDEIDKNYKYDYIICNGDVLFMDTDCHKEIISEILKPEGHLLLTCNNRLGLRYFVGDSDPYTERSFDGLENYFGYTEQELHRFSGRCFAKNEIELGIKKLGFADRQYRGYSIFPGLEMPQLIYAWDFLPNEEMESRYTPLYNDANRVFENETKLSSSLVDNGMFHAMANAYFLDCSFEGEFYEFNQVTTSMERGEERATATIVQKDGCVIKSALYPKGNTSIDVLVENMTELKSRGISTLYTKPQTMKQCDGESLKSVGMAYVDAPIAQEYLQKLIYKDKKEFKDAVCRFLDIVLCSGDVKEDMVSELGPIFDKVYFDLVPINCFAIDGEFVFFDQEYVIENYPVNVVLTRVLDFIYMGKKDMEQILPMSYFTEKYGLKDKLQTYRNMSDSYLNELKHASDLLAFHNGHKADARIVNVNRQKMQYDIQTYISEFVNYLDNIDGKKVFLFGSGLWAKKFVAEYGDCVDIDGMLDNNSAKWGTLIDGLQVINPNILMKLPSDSYKVIICIKQYAEIVKQLKSLGIHSYGIYDPNIDISGLDRRSPVTNQVVIDKKLSEEQSTEISKIKPYNVGFVAGVFDLFHVGHLNLLRRAKEQCNILLVGVVSDEQASKGKSHSPYVSEDERLEIVQACKYVDKAIIMPTVSASARDTYKKYQFDVMFSGDDYKNDTYWLEEREWLRAHGSDIVFFPYTQTTSSTKLKEAIEKNH